MKNLILLTALLATSALADVSVKVNRMEASVVDNAEDPANEAADTKTPAKKIDHEAASGMPTGKRQHRLDSDSDDDGLEDRANDCDDDCDSSESKVEVRGWDPEKKEPSEKSATKKVKIPALDGSSKEPSY